MSRGEILSEGKQIKSKKRVADHGEVFTSDREVHSMLDLVKQETERIDSRFLEPACGSGNFLMEILHRKLNVVDKKYSSEQLDWERYAFIATTSIYGIDILLDNVSDCRNRLFSAFEQRYKKLFKENIKQKYLDCIRYVLSKNIVFGDALTLKTDDENFIVFPEWSAVNGNKIKRRDFVFEDLIRTSSTKQPSLFDDIRPGDNGVFEIIPKPIKEYSLIHFMEVANNEQT